MPCSDGAWRTLSGGCACTDGGGPPVDAARRGGGDDTTRLQALEKQLAAQQEMLREAHDTTAALARQLAAIEDHRDVTADYQVRESVLGSVPESFVNTKPLTNKERSKILRDHAGIYPEGRWPPKLVLKESTKNSKELQNAKKITLASFTTEVSSIMQWNERTAKMCGTTWSRCLDMLEDINTLLDSDPDGWYRAEDLKEELSKIVGCAEASFKLGVDTPVSLRSMVAKKIDVATGVDHLRVDTRKPKTEDFVSSETYKLIEAEAKKKQNLAWAQQGFYPGSRNANAHVFGRPPPKSSGGGGKQTSKQGRGRSQSGRGKGRGRGRGAGRGRGSSSSATSSSSGD